MEFANGRHLRYSSWPNIALVVIGRDPYGSLIVVRSDDGSPLPTGGRYEGIPANYCVARYEREERIERAIEDYIHEYRPASPFCNEDDANERALLFAILDAGI